MPITRAFDAVHGMQTDPPLDQMPGNVMRRIIDYLPEFQNQLLARGGWSNLTGVVAHTGGAVPVYNWVTYCPFSNGAKLCFNGHQAADLAWVSTLDGSTVGTNLGSASLPGLGTSPGIWHRTSTAVNGGLLIVPMGASGQLPAKWDATNPVAVLGGSPPFARVAASWGDWLILANGAAPNGNRIWFSGAGAPETWVLSGAQAAYTDAPEDVLAIVPKGNTIFVFGKTGTHLLIGDLPPPNSTFTFRKFAFAEGIGWGTSFTGMEAVCTYKDFVIWANANGVYKSDGGQPIDLTKLGGIKSYWPFVYKPQSNHKVSVGTYRNYIFVTVLDSSNAAWRCLVYDLDANTWWEWSNIPATQLVHIPQSFGVQEDLLIVDRANNKLGSIAYAMKGFWATTDGNGAVKGGSILTGAYRFGTLGQKRIRRGFITCMVQNSPSPSVIQAGFCTPDIYVQPGSDPTSVVGTNLTLTISGNAVNNGKNLRVPYRIDRRVELIQGYLLSSGGVGISGLDFEAAAYDQVRDGDSR